MTVSQVLNTIRTLLDSGHEWYMDAKGLEYTINNAQREFVELAILKSDERALRPLTVYDTNLVIDPNTFECQTTKVIFNPRNTLLHYEYAEDKEIIYGLSYLAPEIFRNYNITSSISYLADTTNYPKYGYWSYENRLDSNNILQSYVLFSKDTTITDLLCDILYVRYPILFSIKNDKTLEVPEEYQFIVCALAAEKINSIDVLEDQRGVYIPPESGSRITLQKAGDLNT